MGLPQAPTDALRIHVRTTPTIRRTFRATRRLRRNGDAFFQPVDITVTEQGVGRRTETASLEVGWDLVKRVIATKDYWIFAVNQLQSVILWKDRLTPEQVAEVSTFLARRQGPSVTGRPHTRAG